MSAQEILHFRPARDATASYPLPEFIVSVRDSRGGIDCKLSPEGKVLKLPAHEIICSQVTTVIGVDF